ncbi:MAG: hypothetical protein PVJ21_20310 [Anaerolineales bacterium]|jgi:hypothetical protein
MLTVRKILSITLFLVLAACSALPDKGPATQLPSEKSGLTPKNFEPADVYTKEGTLSASILAGFWKDDSTGHRLVPIDPTSGQALADYEPISLGLDYTYTFSPDRRRLAVIGHVTPQYPHGGSLHLIDLEAWEDHVQELKLDAYVNAMDFSPDGKHLAIAYGNNNSQVLVLNVDSPPGKSKTAALQASMDFLVNQMKFTSDGDGLMIYGYRTENPSTVNQMNPEPPFVTLLDSTDLSVLWEADLEGVRHGILPKDENSDEPVDFTQPGNAIYYFPGLTFAPGQDNLYIVHAKEDKLTTVDFEAQEYGSMEIQPQLSWMERLLSLTAGVARAKVAEGTSKQVAISPDGETLYIVGQSSELGDEISNGWEIIENSLGLQIVRASDGKRLSRYDNEASDISISYDGQYLFLHGWNQEHDSGWTQIYGTTTNQPVTRIENNTWLVPTRRLNGEPILASSVYVNSENEHHFTIVDSRDLTTLAEWSSPDYLVWLKVP